MRLLDVKETAPSVFQLGQSESISLSKHSNLIKLNAKLMVADCHVIKVSNQG